MGTQPKSGIYTGTSDSENAIRMTNAMNRRENPEYVFVGNANLQHVPQYYVRIFNVGDKEHRIERPWVNYNPAQRGKIILVPACEPGQRYSKPFTICDIVQMPIPRIPQGEIESRGVEGKFLAQDALNPEDPTGNWRTVRPVGAGVSMNEGTNLYHWGLFWTVNDPPSEEETSTAKNRMEAHYNRLIEEAKALYMGGDDLRRQIGNTHRHAANYFRAEFEWNQIYRSKKQCEGCGQLVNENAAVCPHCTAVFNWSKALQLGLRTVEQAKTFGVMVEQAESLAEAQAKPKGRKS